MRGRHQWLCSTAASFLDANAIILLPLLCLVVLPSPCSAGAGVGSRKLMLMDRVLWVCLHLRGYLLSAVSTPGWKKRSLGGHTDADGAYVALFPPVGAY